MYVACEFGGNVIDVLGLVVMDTNRGIWEDEEVFLGLFKGVAKEEGTSSGNFSPYSFGETLPEPRLFHICVGCDLLREQLSQSQTLSRAVTQF